MSISFALLKNMFNTRFLISSPPYVSSAYTYILSNLHFDREGLLLTYPQLTYRECTNRDIVISTMDHSTTMAKIYFLTAHNLSNKVEPFLQYSGPKTNTFTSLSYTYCSNSEISFHNNRIYTAYQYAFQGYNFTALLSALSQNIASTHAESEHHISSSLLPACEIRINVFAS